MCWEAESSKGDSGRNESSSDAAQGFDVRDFDGRIGVVEVEEVTNGGGGL